MTGCNVCVILAMKASIRIKNYGMLAYRDAFREQLRLHKLRLENKIPDTLMLLEHPHVFTLGRHANDENIVWNDEKQRSKQVEVIKVDRGGEVTYHGPGQLVGYVIIKLGDAGISPRKLVEWVEEMIIQCLEKYNISAYVDPEHPGVWVGNAKICAIGMRIKENVSYHGFALNVSTDLSYFDGIVPCGIKDKNVCSMETILDRKIDIEEVKEILAKETSHML